jgi:hypothetical protein
LGFALARGFAVAVGLALAFFVLATLLVFAGRVTFLLLPRAMPRWSTARALRARIAERYREGMPGAAVPCTNCGAMMKPLADARTYACDYCRTQVLVAVEGHQIAAGMRLDLQNIDNFLGQLANTLHAGYAECTRIQAQGPYVLSIDVTIEPDAFAIRREGSGVVAQHKRMVRGIALKTTTFPLDKWVDMLTKSLARQASSNTRAAWVLARLTGQEHTNVRR